MVMNKGQMYLILATIIVTVLAILRISLNIDFILENNKQLQQNLDTLELANIENGIRQSLVNNYNVPTRSTNVNSFIDFARSSELGRSNTLSGISIQSEYPTAVASSTATMNVTIYNFLGAQIDSMTLTWSYDNSITTLTNLADNTTTKTTFSFNTASNANYILTVSYTSSSITAVKNITIPVEIGASKFIGFYRMVFSTQQGTPVSEFTNTANLNQTQYS